MSLRFPALILFIFAFQVLSAQDLSRLRYKTLPVGNDTLQLDSLSISEGSLIVRDVSGNLVDTSAYFLNPIKSYLAWKTKPETDSVTVLYRTYPFNLSKSVFRKDIARLEVTQDFILNPFEYIPPSESSGIIDFGTLDYNGSFTRGVSFGSNQDVVLNSSFNLQLSGNITDDIEIMAAITDNNIPIQPDGTTAQLQEFDRVFIKISKQPHSLIVGDYEIWNPEGYFMRYFRNLQGANYTGGFKLSEKEKVTGRASLAVTKGRYHRQRIPVSEGNQGPYKLLGVNGETFIIVLAGTERVFINGRQLKRGAENHYIIDYNIGEIIFTPYMLITSDLRLEVEFEYSDRNYFRSTFAVDGVYEREKLKLRAAFYSGQDSKNQPVDADLSSEQISALRMAGDNPAGMLFPGFRFEEYEVNKILYKLIDDSTTAEFDSIFVFSTNPDSARFSVIFTFVGQGRGDYVPAASTANGRVFQWTRPVNGVKQGSYIPYRVLVAPQKQQMVMLGADFKPTDNDFFTAEGALSNNDRNTFSNLDSEDNIGFAVKSGYQRNVKLGAESKKQSLVADVNYEFLHRHFRELERFRTVEFNRDWNYVKRDTAEEHLLKASANYLREGWGNIGYRFSTFISDTLYKGILHQAFSTFDRNGYNLNANLRFLESEGSFQNSSFIRPIVEVSKSFASLRNWKIGGRYEQEINKLRDAQTDTLAAGGFVFNDWRVFIASADTARNPVRLEYIRRFEFYPRENEMRMGNHSNTVNFSGNWLTHKVHRLGWQMTYRKFESRDSLVAARELEHYYLGRIEYGLTVLKGAIATNALYELGAGREPRIQYTYVPVDTGLGNFIWNDYNNNGLQEAFEFEPAPFSDGGNFIRVLNPTNEYVPVDMTQYNQSLSLNPRAVWNNKDGMKGFVARFSTITSLQIDRKVFRNSEKTPFNPFVFDEADSSLVSLSSLARNSLFFNRQSSKYSLEYTAQDNRRKINQVNGIESMTMREHLGRARWNVMQPLNITLTYTSGSRTSYSELYSERSYIIKSQKIEPQFSYLRGAKFRVTTLYSFTGRKNGIGESGETAYSHEATTEARYNIVSKSTLNGRFSFVKINYTGTQNSAIEFAMLQGFKDGNNFTWAIAFERTLAKAVQLSISYEGRKTGEAKSVHIGRVQVRAIF